MFLFARELMIHIGVGLNWVYSYHQLLQLLIKWSISCEGRGTFELITFCRWLDEDTTSICVPTKEPHPRDPSRRELNKTSGCQPHKRPLYTFRWILNVRLIIPYGYTQSINELMLQDIISICIKQQSSPCPGPWNVGVHATFIDILLDGFPTAVQTDDAK